MSGVFYHDSVSVAWSVDLNEKSLVISPNFRFEFFEWFMECEKINQTEICLKLLPKTYPLFSNFDVFTRVESYMGQLLFETKHRRTANSTCILRLGIVAIEEVEPEFSSNISLTFRVILGETEFETEIAPTNALTKGTSSDSSTQTECILSTTTSSDQVPLPMSTFSCLESLSEDLSKLLDRESDSDMEFQCAGVSTKAHKVVVSARSPVLGSMLQSDMVEGRTGVVKLPDIDADTFIQFRRYLYTGKLDELTFDEAISLYESGDQYRVNGLVKRCTEYLTKNLSLENAFDVLIMADAHSDSKFVEAVVDFMVKNKFPLSSDRWSNFSDEQPKLANKVFSRFCQKSKWIGWED